MRITTVLFDLGSTLLYSKDPWPPIYERADRELVRSLKAAGIRLDRSTAYGAYETFLDAYYAQRGGGVIETTTFTALKELLAAQGIADAPEVALHNALESMYAVTQRNWYLEHDAVHTLATLRRSGYHLGMISNTSDDRNVQQLVDRWGLRGYFEQIVTSAGCGIRKPDPAIFRLALDHFRVRPGAAAMVGDTPEADIQGANGLGIRAIWITRRSEKTDPQSAHPDAVVRTLEELPAALAALH
jgi:HAD superfamily hydrolase (TIGR01662 family)